VSDVNQLLPERLYNYVQAAEPNPPNGLKEGETWYETDTDTSWVYDGTDWVELTVTDHTQLSGVSASQHHSPVSVSQPLVNAGNQSLNLSLAAPLHVDANGDLDIPAGAIGNFYLDQDAVTSGKIASGAVGSTELDGSYPDGSIGTADLGFDTATQTELNNHTADSDAHHARPTSTGSYGGNFVATSSGQVGSSGSTYIPGNSSEAFTVTPNDLTAFEQTVPSRFIDLDASNLGDGEWAVDSGTVYYANGANATVSVENFENLSYPAGVVDRWEITVSNTSSTGATVTITAKNMEVVDTDPHIHGV
jgi:hypothetical protein